MARLAYTFGQTNLRALTAGYTSAHTRTSNELPLIALRSCGPDAPCQNRQHTADTMHGEQVPPFAVAKPCPKAAWKQIQSPMTLRTLQAVCATGIGSSVVQTWSNVCHAEQRNLLGVCSVYCDLAVRLSKMCTVLAWMTSTNLLPPASNRQSSIRVCKQYRGHLAHCLGVILRALPDAPAMSRT